VDPWLGVDLREAPEKRELVLDGVQQSVLSLRKVEFARRVRDALPLIGDELGEVCERVVRVGAGRRRWQKRNRRSASITGRRRAAS
jgi:hypothetical protein